MVRRASDLGVPLLQWIFPASGKYIALVGVDGDLIRRKRLRRMEELVWAQILGIRWGDEPVRNPIRLSPSLQQSILWDGALG